MADYTYPLDTTGSASSNFVPQERHTITYDNNADFHFVVPKFAPFYLSSLRVYKVSNGARTPLSNGVHYYPGLHFVSASLATTKDVYGGIVFIGVSIDFEVEIDYQTVGGEWTLDTAAMTEAIINVVKNPAGLTWDQVANVQALFPPIDHPWEFEDIQGQTELIQSVDRIGQAIANRANTPSTGGIAVTKETIGLGKVENNGSSSLLQALDPENTTSNVTPKMLWGVLEQLGLTTVSEVAASMRAHLENKENPHATDANMVGLGQTPNLPLATTDEILSNARVNKLITLEQLIRWSDLYGCKTKSDEVEHPPLGAKLHEYCTDNYDMIGLFADGKGGTFPQLVESKSSKCGYQTKAPITHEPAGQVVNEYCSGGARVGLVSNGLGGYFVRILEANSSKCGGSSFPSTGTVISETCEGTTRVTVVATGDGGTRTDRVENSTNCLTVVYPPASTLKSYHCSTEQGSYDMIGVYHDGSGGTYESPMERNSPDCGYKAPTPAPTSTFPPRGSSLGTSCDTATKTLYNIFADGNGGRYQEVAQVNSPACGYVAPTAAPTPAPTPGNRVGSINIESTHTIIYNNDTEIITIRLSNWTPYATYTVELWIDSAALPAPQTRVTVTIPGVTVDSNGNATITQRAGNNSGAAPKGLYTTWAEVNKYRSNYLNRTLAGPR